MICQSCRLKLLFPSSTRSFSTTVRHYAGTSQPALPASRGPPSANHEGPPAATSTSAAQPFSSKMNYIAEPAATPAKTPAIPKSIAPAGMALKGMAFYKNKDPPLAMEDHEYPAWLWKVLDGTETGTAAGGGAGEDNDIYAKTRKQRRAAAKAARRLAARTPADAVPTLPIEVQTVDLPAGDGTIEGAIQALEARDELTAAMRSGRRKDIKEANFLKGMR